jgi:hypothetical protein
MATKRITERIDQAFSEAKVNRESGQITGVLICGVNSANGREYPAETLRRDYAKYEGRPVNADHGRESTVDRRLGWFSNVAPGPDGRPRGTLNVLRSHKMFEPLMEAAERNPSLFGFSHVALCDTATGKDGRERITAIKSVESIDLVADPATTKGLFESRGNAVKKTIQQLAESVARNPKSTIEQITRIKRLAEARGTVEVTLREEDNAEEMDPKELTTEAFRAAAHAHVDSGLKGEAEPKEVGSKVKGLMEAHRDATKDPEVDEPAEKTDANPEGKVKDDTKESKNKVDPFALLEECRKQGLNPSGAELKVLALMESVDRAAWITDQRKKIAAPETPTSGGARNQPQRRTESKEKSVEVKDVKTFLEAISA